MEQALAAGREGGKGQAGEAGEGVAQHHLIQRQGRGPQDQQQQQHVQQGFAVAAMQPGRAHPPPGEPGLGALLLIQKR